MCKKRKADYMKTIYKKATAVLAAAIIAATAPSVYAENAGSTAAGAGFENKSGIMLEKIGSYISEVSDKDGGVAEIIDYDCENNRAWLVNGATGMLDILDMSGTLCSTNQDITAKSIDIKKLVGETLPDFDYGDMTSIAVCSEKGIAAVALQHASYDKNGYAAVLTLSGELIALFEAGCQPDMICFTPDGTKILTANEGEPRMGYGEGVTDPQGSITVITVDYEDISASQTATVGLEAFDDKAQQLKESGVIFAKGALPSVDLEPEYIACDDRTAYIALQEANAVAVLDIQSMEYKGVYSLGFKDFSLEENAIDLDEDAEYNPKTYTDAVGAYMPDGISLYNTASGSYILTANEGDAREWGQETTEYINEIKQTVTATDGSEAKKVRCIDAAVTDGLPGGKTVLYGGRSFSIFKVTQNGLELVFDSGNEFESKTAAYFPEYFNCSNDDNEYDSRSRKKGPEPESVTVGEINGRTYAFTALERIGGIMVYDITNPEGAEFDNYINTRDFSEDPDSLTADTYLKGDIAPEGLRFVSAEESASGTPLLLAAYEVSGTAAVYAVGEEPAHSISDEWTGNDTEHWHECDKCGEQFDKAAHSGGTATCTNAKVCEICAAQYGEKDKTNHENTALKNNIAPNCTENGSTGDTVCLDCGEIIKAAELIEKTGHSYENGVCSICGQAAPDTITEESSDNDSDKENESSAVIGDSEIPENPPTGKKANIASLCAVCLAAAVAVTAVKLRNKK